MKHAEKLSKRIFYIIIAFIVVVFFLFYSIGYKTPFWDDTKFNAPLLTDVLLFFMLFLFVGTIGVAIWSIITSLKKRGKSEKTYNGIPVKRITYLVVIGTILLLIITLLFSSSLPMMINGKQYTDVGWLKIADMFIWSSGLLILISFGAVVFGASRSWRKSGNHKLIGEK